MSAEDRLRDILRNEAAGIVPAGDGLTRIQERITHRRRLRLVLVPAGALATAAAVVAVITLSGNLDSQNLKQDPITPITQVPTVSPTPTPAQPSPTQPAVAPYTGPAIWPFTSSAQGEAWKADHGNRPWAGDSLAVATHFVDDFLKLTGVSAVGTGDTIFLRVQGNDVARVDLVQISSGGPWTVIDVWGRDLTITSPAPMARVTSPTRVTGRVQQVDENVRLQLISSGTGEVLADTSAPAGREIPWEGTLTWSNQSWFTGGVVAVTRSAKDGAVTRITAIPVKRGG